MTDLVNRAKEWAIQAHGEQRYGDQPYKVHLYAVVQILKDFGATPEQLAAGWMHDVLEDTEVGDPVYGSQGIGTELGAAVEQLVWSCTGVGYTRAQRVASIYKRLAKCPAACLVKCADRIANVEAAAPGSSHMERYRREAPGFKKAVRPHVPPAMWDRLERALAKTSEPIASNQIP